MVRGLATWIPLAAAVATCISACSDDGAPTDVSATATRRTALDALFHQEPRWLGGDAAYSIDLGDDHSVWLFGDSFIATSAAHKRSESKFVRNSIALMTGRDLATATMQFAWNEAAQPSSYFPEAGDHWFWPGGGVRVPNGPLLVFTNEVRPTPNEGLGFAGAGFTAVRIVDPSGAQSSWQLEPTDVHAPPFSTEGVACATIDDDHVIAVIATSSSHDSYLARWPLAAITAGELGAAEWWKSGSWVAEAAVGTPSVVIPDGATECSLHRDATTGRWIYIWSRGFGGSTIAMRSAPAITGPYSAARDLLTPPESMLDNPFVYAAKAHPQLRTSQTGIALTFADNSFTFADLFDPVREPTLYWPHVVDLTIDSVVEPN
jgi:hypothetical protein